MFDLFNSSENFSEEPTPDTKERIRLSYEDQLYVWCVLLQNNLAGRIAPQSRHDRRTNTEYSILIPEHLCLQEFNHLSDIGPITINQLRATAKTFRYLKPPYAGVPNGTSKHRNKQSTGISTY
jgi:hypothetical protein